MGRVLKANLNRIVIIGSIVIALFIGLSMIRDPKVKGKESGEFSAENAYSYLESIGKAPHSVFNREALEEVRQYIAGTLQEMGLTTVITKHNDTLQQNVETGKRETVEVKNIYTQIPGTSGQYILLMAHYDSSPYKIKYGEVTSGSHGAADDGYGVVTILEILRLLQNSNQPLVNGVKVVFTDSEETGLNGAYAVVNENPEYLSDVNLVVNIEARGNHGPLYMFQTSGRNSKIINLYSRVDRPFSFSVAAEVYKYLPSDTDLTPFLNAGYNCINFSTLNDLRSYHTKDDILENTSKGALQAYGSQVYPLVKSYVYTTAYSESNSFNSSSDSVFFALLPGVLVHYPVTVSWFILAFAVLFAVFILLLLMKRKLLSLINVVKSVLLWTVFLFVAAIAGYAAVRLPCLVTGTPFHLTFMPYVPYDRFLLSSAAVILSVAAYGVMRLQLRLKLKTAEVLSGGLLFNILFLLIFANLLHGGTYLYVWPVLLTSLLLAGKLFTVSSGSRSAVYQYTVKALLTIFIVLMYFLLVYSLFLALTIGALAVILLLLSIPLSVLIPSMCYKEETAE